uniref:Candidate secreted effector n=1 Tax=Meloidogyne incognita TaxID=6306 RepID=A0A914N6Z4_MELIC
MPHQQSSSSNNYLILNLLSNKDNTFIFDSITCVFPNLQNCRSIELRRFKCCSFNENSENLNKYIDAIFVETNNSPIKKRENKEICIFEEIQSVEWKGVSNNLVSDDDDDENEFGNKEGGNYCSITKSFTGQNSIWGEYIIEEKYEEDKNEGEEEGEEEEEQNYRGN